LTFDPYDGSRSIPSVLAKNEKHGPHLYFSMFTRRRIEKCLILFHLEIGFIFIAKVCMFSLK